MNRVNATFLWLDAHISERKATGDPSPAIFVQNATEPANIAAKRNDNTSRVIVEPGHFVEQHGREELHVLGGNNCFSVHFYAVDERIAKPQKWFSLEIVEPVIEISTFMKECTYMYMMILTNYLAAAYDRTTNLNITNSFAAYDVAILF